MKKILAVIVYSLLVSSTLFSQTLDTEFSRKKMKKDLKVFKKIRLEANSGLYRYRTKSQIDSSYNWALKEIEKSNTYGDFYNIICALTDFEGSLHNDTALPDKLYKSIKGETKGYFPIPIKLIEDKVIVNIENSQIPLGANIISINGHKIKDIIANLYKYYTTDGVNITGKSIGINASFSKYYRLHYGLQDAFKIEYKTQQSDIVESTLVESTSYIQYHKNVANRYSKPFDEGNYKDWEDDDEIYTYKTINKTTGVLTVNSFSIGGNEDAPEHKTYVNFLDSVFLSIKKEKIENLIVDIRYNGGGSDPNDLVTYSYLTQRNFSENKEAWISFYKIPCLKYVSSSIPAFLRPLGVGKYNRLFQKEFPTERDGKYYQNEDSNDHKIWKPNENAFKGNIYLLISPGIASAGSLFGAMVAGNDNTTVIGEETMGTYYGHNGHTPLPYILPKSKIATTFSVVNLEQDVPKKDNQIYNRGIIPDYEITQTYDDFLNQTDVQMNFVLDLIKQDK